MAFNKNSMGFKRFGAELRRVSLPDLSTWTSRRRVGGRRPRQIAALLVIGMLFIGGWAGGGAVAQSESVCDRTFWVRDAIEAASGEGCAQLTLHHLREITTLDLRNQSIPSLRASDFDGLVRLETLDLSGNVLTSLPPGVFDELYLLKTLRLDGNLLETLPDGIFDELFLLEELTLHGNLFTSLPVGLFEEFSRFDGMQADGSQPDNSGSYPRIHRFLDRHDVSSQEEFIAALPAPYLQRFVLMYRSESPAAPHVSEDYPRVISFGGDGAMTFAWTTDPSAPAPFSQSVEFLRQNDTDWTAGVIDYSGASPQIIAPASCKSCHGSFNKPMWGMWGQWSGSEYVSPPRSEEDIRSADAAMGRVMASSDPLTEPLDFTTSSFETSLRAQRFFWRGPPPSTAVAEEAGAVWAWRHAEVLYRILRGRYPDFRSFSDEVVCAAHDDLATFAVALNQFSQPEQNLFASDADPRFPDQPGYVISTAPPLLSYTYHYHTGGSVADSIVFLLIADVLRDEPIVRRLYRSVSNSDAVVPHVTDLQKSAMLYYGPGSATAEDELIQKLRLHFGQGTAASLDAREAQNGRHYLGGVLSASFRDGLATVMRPRMCSALTGSVPGGLSVALEDGDAVLSWDAPSYDTDAVTGYRIWRGVGTADPTIHVTNTASTWTDAAPEPGQYVYAVQALYDDYYLGRESPPVRFAVTTAPQAVENLSATLGTGKVTLNWDAPSSGVEATGYQILRGPAASSLEVLVWDTSNTKTTYVDTTVTTGAGYAYSVKALTGASAGPAAEPVTVEAAAAAPVVTGVTTFTVMEGETAVGTLTATDEDTSAGELTWALAGGADQGRFTLSAAGVLAFASAKDYESPDDVGGDGTYALTVQVSDGKQSGTADFSVTLSNRNEAPSANAGADQDGIEGGATVRLSGTGTDPDAGDTPSYGWTQTGGTTVTLSAADAAATSFTAPSDLPAEETLRFTLRMTDAGGLYAEDEVAVTVEAAAAAPVVTGATMFTVMEGETAVGTLTATDEDTSAGELTWALAGGADQGRFTLSAAGVLAFASAKDYESPDDVGGDGTYALTVQVSDGKQSGTADLSVTLSNRNEAPSANAGADQDGIEGGATVRLSGTGTDPDAGDTPSYGWTQTGGTTVTLSAADAAATSFTAPSDLPVGETLRFTLRVTDAGGLYAEDEVAVTVEAAAAAPVVTGVTTFTVMEGETAVGTLTATDEDTSAGDLTWSLAGGADQGSFRLSSAGVLAFASAKDFESPDDVGGDGTYALTVQVSDGKQSGTADLSVTLSNRNEAPSANAGADQDGIERGATVSLSGTGTDPDAGDTPSYGWTQTGGTTVTLSAADAAATSFTAPSDLSASETLRFTLRVTDAGGLYAEDEVAVTVEAAASTPLTARVERVPERHNGNSVFTFELHFSEEVNLSYVTLRDSVFEVTAGTVVNARRQSQPSNRSWYIDVEPTSDADVELVLPAGRACGVTGAICTADGRRLSNRLDLSVAGSSTAQLTALVERVPDSHDGTTFRFRLRFSAEIDIGYVTLRDNSFDVTGGLITYVQRLARPSNRDWEITVALNSNANVVLVLAADRACDTAGAICTAEGERLSNRLEITVPAQP